MAGKSNRRAHKLKYEHKAFVVQMLACFDGPKEVADALKAEYGIVITPQGVETYDPTKKAGGRLSKRWRDIFEQTRKDFLANPENHVPIANKTVRLRETWKAFLTFKSRGNLVAALNALEQAAKEVGNVHTNRREITGRDGKPIEFADMSDAELDQKLGAALEAMGMSVTNSGAEADDGSPVH